ncbi:DedA family protein/thiosulfate sulfurtransferase GlpE [Uliginosibacterium sediminicola]|uniref:DedA family protein/thiosulfate sulfurtransferase GlpE n=1 Tax=Uliginosibacterium sediminicola TaxID=2024550 RepID=A0ABU9YU59_9RHOO
MQQLITLFNQHGPLLVFLQVLVTQLGAPVPAVPTLMVAGALAVDGHLSALSALILAVLGSGIANFIWYLAGRRYGMRILGLMCRISISPDACVRRTENVFTRWGAWSLLVSRFVPGLSMLSSPLAGATGLAAWRFILFDGLGTALWASAAIGGGMLLHHQVEVFLKALASIGSIAVLVILGLLALYIAWRWIERQQLLRFVRKHRIDAEELYELISTDNAPIIVDVRSQTLRAEDSRRIPGALEAELADVRALLGHLPREQEIVFYCNCPNEASAAHAARQLRALGFKRVRPLSGGLDAWLNWTALTAEEP